MPFPLLTPQHIRKACSDPRSPEALDTLAYASQLAPSRRDQEKAQKAIYSLAHESGVYCASLASLYDARARNEWSHATVPACNIRTLTYQFSYVFHKAIREHKLGPVIFEIALSEQQYTHQTHAHYATSILAGALKAGYTGPVFLLGDHYQAKSDAFRNQKEAELTRLKDNIRDAIRAGFYNIDIDASTLVQLDLPLEKDQQKDNFEVTAYLTKYIRSLEPENITIAIGGEIGHIGGVNSTDADFDAFMTGYANLLPSDMKGLSKIALQTGTSHGGTPLPDGTLKEVTVDTSLHANIGARARELGLGGTVQHGASTLPLDTLHIFPESETLEIHLATGWQNLLFEHMPSSLKRTLESWVIDNLSHERHTDETLEQFVYSHRKKAWGPCKYEVWRMHDQDLATCLNEIEKMFLRISNQLRSHSLHTITSSLYTS